ncbi:hypothetical protein BST61_g4332 [Cercospora zeina]
MTDEIARLRAELAEAQRGREIAERRREEAQRGQQEERRRREEEQRRREEEQRRREHAEQVAATAVKQTLAAFLESCHALCRRIRPVTDPSSVTRGPTTDPTSRLFPQTIALWEDFGERQQRTWAVLGGIAELWQEPLYPSIEACKSIEGYIDPIGSEDDLRFLQRLTVEKMVQDMHEALVGNHPSAPGLLGHGQISFENQERFRGAEMATLSDTIGELAIQCKSNQLRRNTRADQFCVLWREDGSVRPLIAIEYKAPHKLTIEEICTGLQSDINTERDVIDQDGDSFVFFCRRLLAAVITQLFSYMIDKCVSYGYICTGEAYIFLRIPDDPTAVYFSVHIPKNDYEVDAESRLERTAVSQVFAFIQQALSEDSPGQAWIDDAKARLKRWQVEFVDVLATIPETERKSKEASEYRPRVWRKGMRRSPIGLRSQCGGQITDIISKSDESESDGAEQAASPTPRAQTRSRTARNAATRRTGGRGQQQAPPRGEHARTRIQQRAYCSHNCLLGLYQGLAIDPSCPNAIEHGPRHLSQASFLRHVRQQLATDRGSAANCCPLFIHGSRGALLKLRLNIGGYTLVAKGMGNAHRSYLEHEATVYGRLKSLQGRYVPVCCGIVGLKLPYHYDGVELRHILLLSWAGESLAQLMVQYETFASIKPMCDEQAKKAYEAIRSLQVLHCDEAPRNMVYNANTGQLMILDFERSRVVERQALSEIPSNRKRKLPSTQRRREKNKRGEASCIAGNFRKVSPVEHATAGFDASGPTEHLHEHCEQGCAQ